MDRNPQRQVSCIRVSCQNSGKIQSRLHCVPRILEDGPQTFFHRFDNGSALLLDFVAYQLKVGVNSCEGLGVPQFLVQILGFVQVDYQEGNCGHVD